MVALLGAASRQSSLVVAQFHFATSLTNSAQVTSFAADQVPEFSVKLCSIMAYPARRNISLQCLRLCYVAGVLLPGFLLASPVPQGKIDSLVARAERCEAQQK